MTIETTLNVPFGRVAGKDITSEKVAEAQIPFVLEARDLHLYYGSFLALRNVSLPIRQNKITALIGPSGCGKSTLLRSFNRMNDFIPNVRIEGSVLYENQNIYAPNIDPVAVRRHIGMVFQKPNPFPKSVYENVAWGARINGYKGNMDELVEKSLRQAALWDEVKDKLKESGLSLSGGQQQRLCIARTIAVAPDIILMDEPCSALDPIATIRIEELMKELVTQYSIVIVTHNMQQAMRVSDYTAMMMVGQGRAGEVAEFDRTSKIFNNPSDKRTADYIAGKFG
jgi:phosphate transport system ATP-binding protein